MKKKSGAKDRNKLIRPTFTSLMLLSACLFWLSSLCFGAYTETKLTAADGAANDLFGYSIAQNEDIIVVGAVGDGNFQGAVFVYRYDDANSVWEEEVKLTASDGSEDDRFGYSVAVNGNTIVVGAMSYDNYRGAAYVYKYNESTSTWEEQVKLTASDGSEGDRFGYSVAVSENIIVVGAMGYDGIRGAAYVYKYNESTFTWDEQAKLTASDGSEYEWFGYSVAVSGDTIVVGANFDDMETGAAYVYKYNESTFTWDEQAKLTASDGQNFEEFGHSVAVSGDTIVVGKCGDDSYRGAAYVYEYNESTSTWEEQVKLTPPEEAEIADFGDSIAFSEDTIVVGARRLANATGAAYVGAAYVYKYNESTSTWEEEVKLTASDGSEGDWFGGRVTVNKDTIVVGAVGDNNSQGAAYVYRPLSVKDTQEFFDDAVTDGHLTGVGNPPKAAAGKLNALRNMLDLAEYYLESGLITEACQQLMDAYLKTDGNPNPPDFVEGDAAPDLADMIQELIDTLGCQAP
jgi:hypothetical protein